MITTDTAFEDTALLSEIEEELHHQPASTGLRFANLLLDIIGFYSLLFVVGIGLGLYAVAADDEAFLELYNGKSFFIDYLISYTIYVLYFTLVEGLTKGRSLGKLITGTRAVRLDGSTFTWADAFKRSLCRIVPFEPFSAFGYAPWHDKWTDTTVIKKIK